MDRFFSSSSLEIEDTTDIGGKLRELEQLREAARDIFASGLQAVNSYEAIKRSVRVDGSRLTILDSHFELNNYKDGIYVIALGKAGLSMALALDDVLGETLTSGVITAPGRLDRVIVASRARKLSPSWSWLQGGHPLPNEASLAAASESFRLLEKANTARSLIIFLISGGGSATIEWPQDNRITLDDLREANRQLISCGASISEVNTIRKAFSAVKGGKLSARSPKSTQVTLIISDTNRGDEANVASGPTLTQPPNAPDLNEIVDRYNLSTSLPPSIMATIRSFHRDAYQPSGKIRGSHYVLLDNRTAIDAAAAKARELGFVIEIADEIIEQPIDTGSDLLVSSLVAILESVGSHKNPVCVISGGEFSCPVIGDGRGGRNFETALRCAIKFEQLRRRGAVGDLHLISLSGGTDGLDGNSPAAGAISDETTVTRGIALGLDAEKSLENSDSYTFFNTLGDAIITGSTDTNVRDLRILIAANT